MLIKQRKKLKMKKIVSDDEYKNRHFSNVKVVGNEIVVQSNSLIDSFKRTKLRELKILCFLLSKIDPLKPDDMSFRITVKDLAQAIGSDLSIENVYRDTKNIIQNLSEKIITIHSQENGKRSITYIPFLSYAKYWIDEGYADVVISPHLAPYVLNLNREFTQYKLINVMHMSSTYALRLYEMLKKQEMIGSRTFYLDDLRKKLGVSDKFLAYKDFRVRVLDIARREINLKTDLQISYVPKKVRQKVVAIVFDIKKKELIEGQKIEDISKGSNSDNLFNISAMNIQKLLDFGFSLSDISKMLSNITDNETTDAIAAVEEQISKGKTRNKKALIRTALKMKWKKNIEPESISEKKSGVREENEISTTDSNEYYEEYKNIVRGLAEKFTSVFKKNK